MIAVNITGMFVATQESGAAHGRGRPIIHIGSSMVRYAVFPTASVYTLTKCAVSGFSRSLVRDLGRRGITVNILHPGLTDTDMNPTGGPVSKVTGPVWRLAATAVRRRSQVRSPVAYLASPEAAFVIGAEPVADGGFTPVQSRP